MLIEISYGAYLALSLAATIWVARTLHASGRVFLIRAFHNDETLADSVNRLLVVGFYLINIGYVARAMQTHELIETSRDAIELVVGKVGLILLVLGAMHIFNLFVFNHLRARGEERAAPPPLPADARFPVTE